MTTLVGCLLEDVVTVRVESGVVLRLEGTLVEPVVGLEELE